MNTTLHQLPWQQYDALVTRATSQSWFAWLDAIRTRAPHSSWPAPFQHRDTIDDRWVRGYARTYLDHGDTV